MLHLNGSASERIIQIERKKSGFRIKQKKNVLTCRAIKNEESMVSNWIGDFVLVGSFFFCCPYSFSFRVVDFFLLLMLLVLAFANGICWTIMQPYGSVSSLRLGSPK